MPQHSHPGVFVQEVPSGLRPIEGVPTSVAGMAGLSRYGPVASPAGARVGAPRPVASFSEFERLYGGGDDLLLGSGAGSATPRTTYLAHAARAFFDNGGGRLYVSRVFAPRGAGADTDWGVASHDLGVIAGAAARWRARWPGRGGNLEVGSRATRRATPVLFAGGSPSAPEAGAGTVVAVSSGAPGGGPLAPSDLRVVRLDAAGGQRFLDASGGEGPPAPGDTLEIVELTVSVRHPGRGERTYAGLAADPEQRRWLRRVLDRDQPEDAASPIWLDWTPGEDPFAAARLIVALQNIRAALAGGHDGRLPTAAELAGQTAWPDVAWAAATGLAALADTAEIAVVALPDAPSLADETEVTAATRALIDHARQAERFRFAVVDGPPGASLDEIRAFRGRFDSPRAALYHPWVEVAAPGGAPGGLLIPPSGAVAGVYARSDRDAGVHKAPANAVLRSVLGLEQTIEQAAQEVLNPEGINVLRFFPGRGVLVWGARTLSADSDWRYVPTARLVLFLEHSISAGTRWVVFEPNDEPLWAQVRSAVENFLIGVWRSGALVGTSPDEAFFVRCDRTTMTQNDIDAGRLVCLIGVAPARPAEFVIFRIGQWTADADTP